MGLLNCETYDICTIAPDAINTQEIRNTTHQNCPKFSPVLALKDNDNLTTEQKLWLKNLLEFGDIFTTNDYDMGKTNKKVHRIDVGYTNPVKQKSYRSAFTQTHH